MRFLYEKLGVDIELSEGLYGLKIENPEDLKELAENVWKQNSGEIGNVYITKCDKALNWNKEICIVWNPFSVDLNGRKVLENVYSELQQIAETDYYEKTKMLNSQIIQLVDNLESQFQYPLVYELDFDIQQLFKMYNVRIDMQGDNLLERLINYIKICHQILHIDFMVLFNTLQYLTTEERKLLNEAVTYEQITLLFIANSVDKCCSKEKWWIIDDDKCIIEVQEN